MTKFNNRGKCKADTYRNSASKIAASVNNSNKIKGTKAR